ncbi:hypothetical protein CY0110_19917 [Crocosphaera chwakensis CCY0110]|uniref:Uncharacterized protein n=1 Tax=Crocosphaera chwakensis CCY0110 TaxID=391612 RepID=A3IJW5_9CHRO|nr:hypothetical protein CY0110_19917 [Crocosphaera chwakensis CCY0110]
MINNRNNMTFRQFVDQVFLTNFYPISFC